MSKPKESSFTHRPFEALVGLPNLPAPAPPVEPPKPSRPVIVYDRDARASAAPARERGERVRPAPPSQHRCHAYRCKTPVQPEIFMCKEHWKSLPLRLRRAITDSYRPGQCDDFRISPAYATAAQAAILAVAEEEGFAMSGNEPELTLYDRLKE